MFYISDALRENRQSTGSNNSGSSGFSSSGAVSNVASPSTLTTTIRNRGNDGKEKNVRERHDTAESSSSGRKSARN